MRKLLIQALSALVFSLLTLPQGLARTPTRCERLLAATAPALNWIEEGFLRKFFKETPYKTWDQFEKAMREVSDPAFQELIQILEKEDLELATLHFEGRRNLIIQRGEIVSGYVSGSLRSARDYAERELADQELPNEIRPIYGLIRSTPERGWRSLEIEDNYGNDVWVLDPDKLRGRISFSFGDSLSRYNQRYIKRRAHADPKVFPANPPEWDVRYIPWKYRLLLVPYLFESSKHQNIFAGPNYGPTFSGRLPFAEFELSMYGRSFVELQIFGPISLDEIKAFEFKKTPPTDAFLEELRKRRIPIFDARREKIVHLE